MDQIIIDSHLHLPVYSNLETLEDKKRQLLVDLAKNKIWAAIVIADSESPSVIGTNEECINLLKDCKNIFVMVGISPLINFKANLIKIEGYLRQKEAIAVKIYPGHEHYYVNDPRLEDVFILCETFDVPLAIHTGWSNPHFNAPSLFVDVAKRHPKLKIVNCHLWYPNIDECYEVTKGYENIYYDISSLAHKKENISMVTVTLTKIAKENPHRLLFGTDYGACDHESHISLVNDLPIDDDVKDLILRKNAIRIYNLDSIK